MTPTSSISVTAKRGFVHRRHRVIRRWRLTRNDGYSKEYFHAFIAPPFFSFNLCGQNNKITETNYHHIDNTKIYNILISYIITMRNLRLSYISLAVKTRRFFVQFRFCPLFLITAKSFYFHWLVCIFSAPGRDSDTTWLRSVSIEHKQNLHKRVTVDVLFNCFAKIPF